VRRLLRPRLASWKIPTRIVALPRFPATQRGKVDAAGLRQLLSAPRIATSISTFRAARQISAPR
jgi:non-ribosomal peptide synthetase component E (peptide arylation enzyme)